MLSLVQFLAHVSNNAKWFCISSQNMILCQRMCCLKAIVKSSSHRICTEAVGGCPEKDQSYTVNWQMATLILREVHSQDKDQSYSQLANGYAYTEKRPLTGQSDGWWETLSSSLVCSLADGGPLPKDEYLTKPAKWMNFPPPPFFSWNYSVIFSPEFVTKI